MTTWAIRIHGDPQPKGSMKGFVRAGRVVIVEDDKTGARKPWRKDLGTGFAALAAKAGGTIDGPVRVRLFFWLNRPSSARRRFWPHVRPDIDKLTRMVLDAMQDGGLLTDDAQVVELWAIKAYADTGVVIDGVEARARPGVSVEITPITEPPTNTEQPALETHLERTMP